MFLNLIDNATEILLETNAADPRIAIHATAVDGLVLIKVSDNGPGIPSDERKTLLDPFVTRQKSGGTGLRLTIVKQYIEAHDGTVSIENDPGAVFTISLPSIS